MDVVEEEEQAEVASDADGFDRSDVRDRDGEGKGEGKTGEEGSRMEVLQAELVSIQASISQLDENIARMKEARGWLIRNPSSKKKLPNNAHASLWRSILSSGGLPGVVYSQQDLDHTGYHGKKGVGGRGGRPGGPARGLKRGREPGGYQLQSLNSAGRLGKRARQPSAKERRLESFWGQCGTILNAIKKHRYSWPFLEPVDPVALNLPDYLSVVSHPMDLGTITKRLEACPGKGTSRYYQSLLEFRDDMRLVWANCRAYNRPGQDVRIMGDFLSEMWERKWCQSEIEDKWRAEQEGNPQGVMQGQMFLSGPVKKPRKGHIELDREMSFTEKRRLAQLIGSLNGEQLVGIVDILLADRAPPPPEEELELDLDKINPRTLWKMKQCVDGLHSRRKGRHPAKKPVSGSHSQLDNGGDMLSSQLLGTPSMADTEDDGISEISLGMQQQG